MSSVKQIGEVSKKSDCEVEWKINNIFSYSVENKQYFSPSFSTSGSQFYFHICPYGETCNNSTGWISLFLKKVSTPTKSVIFTLGIKKVDGSVERVGTSVHYVFEEEDLGLGYAKFMDRSKLLLRRSELAPLNALTVICTLQVDDSFNSISKLDTLSQNFMDMFISKRGCDVTLKVKLEEFSAHKSILSARSPVFAAMFEVDMMEKNTGIVHIVDCRPEVFRYFLVYLYSGKVENLSTNAFQLYKIADKYDVKELKSACIIFIMSNLSIENMVDAFTFEHQFPDGGLRTKIQKFFNKNFVEIVSTTKWKSLLKQNCDLANELLVQMAAEMKSKK